MEIARLGTCEDIGEPGFAHLLLTACFVQRDEDVRIFDIEIRWGIVERDVPIFADAEERDIDWGRGRCWPTSRTTTDGSAASPSSKWYRVIPVFATSCSISILRKLPG